MSSMGGTGKKKPEDIFPSIRAVKHGGPKTEEEKKGFASKQSLEASPFASMLGHVKGIGHDTPNKD